MRARGNLYSLRDGTANWCKKAIKHLIQIKGKISMTDPCLIIFQTEGRTLEAAKIWVDNNFMVGG